MRIVHYLNGKRTTSEFPATKVIFKSEEPGYGKIWFQSGNPEDPYDGEKQAYSFNEESGGNLNDKDTAKMLVRIYKLTLHEV